ncbi:MAG: hypothetical protein KAJ49_08925 [Arcobacteraceae bacterium]|nr:hypothetical protein [Arcobacteraceae bacterium]
MNKNILKGILIFGLVFSIIGCSKSNTIKQIPVKKTTKTISNDGKPLWISNPNMDGYIGVVSVVSKKKIKNKKKLTYIATMKARAEFQTRKGTNIDSTSQTKVDSTGKMDYSEKVKISSTHIQTTKLVVKKTFEDKDNFYMWMVVDK